MPPVKRLKQLNNLVVEYFNNILCISKPELTAGDSPIMSESAYDQYTYRCKKDGIPVKVREGKGHENHALLDFSLLRSDIKEKVIAKYGDPYKTVKHNQFKDKIKPDPKAKEYYESYILADGRRLPLDVQKEYYTNATILNALQIMISDRKSMRKAMGGRTVGIWDNIAEVVNSLNREEIPHSLPSNARRLQDSYKTYMREGYESLISGKWCNKNTEKINDVAKIWIIARWANQVDKCANEQQLLSEYNDKAVQENWKTIMNVGTIHNYLYRDDIKEMWWGYRYGELKAKEKFAFQHSTILPGMRDSLWYSDGTKLNYYFLNDEGKVETCNVYEVIDTYSEMLLGYHISKSEDYEAQFSAYKMAFKTSGHKPYQITYDNQGGHKKLENGNLLNKLAHLAIKTQPYNGKSKTIENIFARLQEQFLKRDWFFTGQNITTKRNESKANMEFVLENKKNLPTLNEIKAKYAARREEWNAAPHPKTGISRREMYYSSHNEQAPKVTAFDMVDMFWITREKPITLNAYGLSFEEKKEKYTYMVYDSQRMPDIAWMRRHIDTKFIVRFDPEDMSLIYLYEQDASGLRFVTEAETKVVVHRGKQEQEPWEAEFFKNVEKENKRLRVETRDKVEEILAAHNMLPEQHGLNSAPIKGVESSRKKRKEYHKSFKDTDDAPSDIGQVQKNISNAVALHDDDTDEIDYLSTY